MPRQKDYTSMVPSEFRNRNGGIKFYEDLNYVVYYTGEWERRYGQTVMKIYIYTPPFPKWILNKIGIKQKIISNREIKKIQSELLSLFPNEKVYIKKSEKTNTVYITFIDRGIKLRFSDHQPAYFDLDYEIVSFVKEDGWSADEIMDKVMKYVTAGKKLKKILKKSIDKPKKF